MCIRDRDRADEFGLDGGRELGDGAAMQEGEAEHADVVERGGFGDGGADAGGAFADEIVRPFMPEGAQNFIEMLGVGKGDHDQAAGLGDVAGKILHESLPVGEAGDGVELDEELADVKVQRQNPRGCAVPLFEGSRGKFPGRQN